MGYFSNGCEGEDYWERWCAKCIHDDMEAGRGCPVLLAHLLWNYDECNKPDSILHKMIPRSEEGRRNGRCFAFSEKK